ncbi:hypothetical protein [Nocardia mexicana]|uniref:Uncharacterized protein n=1 Tax=Nocardia mexicana TaxID=279262 RepID=A0A370H616_9NOCA|nr:hypothetical protein [Nocardia mexicana]RDI51857.1 hypothetical protein DFR68_104341 [Nocardia mexicana]
MAKHRRQTRSQRIVLRAAVSVVPMTAIATGSTIAYAAPAQFIAPQPGVTTPNQPNPAAPQQSPGAVQPGVTTPAQPKTPPPMAYVAPQDDRRGVAPETDFAQYRSVPERNYVAPAEPQKLHAPEPSPPVAQIVPPPRILRAGDLSTPAPDFLSPEQIDGINSVPAGPEAQLSQTVRSVGIPPSRADRVASSAVAGAAVGAAVGCAVGAVAGVVIMSVPACLILGALNGAAGGMIGASAGLVR